MLKHRTQMFNVLNEFTLYKRKNIVYRKGRDKLLGGNYYHRSFIILKSNDSGYGLHDGKEPAGYCKIEIKRNQGKIQLYIQDMKPIEAQQGIYDVVLVSESMEIAPLKLTSIEIEDSGRGEYEIIFDPTNMHDSGLSVDMFHALAVVYRPLIGSGTLQYPLIGYSNKRVELDWKGTVTNKLNQIYHPKSQNEPIMTQLVETDETEDAEAISIPEQEFAPIQQNTEESPVSSIESNELQKAQVDDDIQTTVEGSVLNEQQDMDAVENVEAAKDEESFYRGLEGSYNANKDYNVDETSNLAPEEELINPGGLINSDYLANPDGLIDTNSLMDNTDEGLANIDTLSYDDGLTGNVGFDEIPFTGPEYAQAKMPDMEYSQYPGSENNPYSMNLGNNTYWDKVKDYFIRLFENHKKVCPFDEVVGEVDWIRVEHRNEPLYAHYYRPSDAYNNGSAYLDHYLVGLVRIQGMVQYVVYGIPGIYSAVPPMSMHGFSRWLPVKNGYGSGYWLLYIDAMTGDIAYPY